MSIFSLTFCHNVRYNTVMINKEQIKAARALLNWSQKTLAEKCEQVSAPTIKLIETGKINSKPDTLGIIQQTFENDGIEFLPQSGVRFRDDLLTIIDGRSDINIFLRLLDDIYYTMKKAKGEVLWSFIDENISPPEVIAREKMIRDAGIAYRNLIRYGDTNIVNGPVEEYRWLPEGYFLHNLTAVYGDKFATVVQKPQDKTIDKIILINDPSIAEMKRKEFEIIWNYGAIPQ